MTASPSGLPYARRPTGPRGLPLVGNLPWFLADKLGFLTSCAARYGDVVKLRIGEPTYLLTNPADIQHVLLDKALSYSKTPRLTSQRGRRLSGSGMQTSSGSEHLRQRRLLQPLFQRKSVETFYPVMLRKTVGWMDRWSDGGAMDAASEMESLALSTIIGTLFGTGFDETQLAQAITVRRRYIEYVYASLLPFPEYLPAEIVFKYHRAMQTIDDTIHAEIANSAAGKGAHESFTSILSEVAYPDGSRMTTAQIRDEILSFASTGYETIGDALGWTLYLLAEHPHIERAIADELFQVLGQRVPHLEDITKLVYTRKVLEESMRLYPPTWIFVRMALRNDQLPSGPVILRGSKVYLCQYVVHRDPRYFPEPERFDPERFSEAARSGRPRFAYFPFGGGSRTCIGEQFALLESLSILAMVLSRFRFLVDTGQKIALRPTITLRPKHGIRMRVFPR
jgi:cytochrome P450